MLATSASRVLVSVKELGGAEKNVRLEPTLMEDDEQNLGMITAVLSIETFTSDLDP